MLSPIYSSMLLVNLSAFSTGQDCVVLKCSPFYPWYAFPFPTRVIASMCPLVFDYPLFFGNIHILFWKKKKDFIPFKKSEVTAFDL